MKNFKLIKAILASIVFVGISPYISNAQLQTCNVFLQGNYIEVGINYNGAYGSGVAAPSGYHPNGSSSVYDSCSGTYSCPTFGTGLGFVADPDKDGWTSMSGGAPWPYCGDYFLPGTPQEGWSVQADNYRFDAYNGYSCSKSVFNNYNYYPSYTSGGNLSYSAVGSKRTGVWQGVFDSLRITQITILDTANVFFTTFITIANTAAVTRHGVYYLRTLDPDNDEPESSVGGSFTTNNSIDYQLPNALNATLVSATGLSSPKAYLGLGTLDCRAHCFIINSSLFPNTGMDTGSLMGTTMNNLDSMYSFLNTSYQYSGTNTADQGVGLVFKLGDIKSNDSVGFAYAYILSKADLTKAFATTVARWTDYGDTAAFATGDTALVCKNAIIPVNILNGGFYSWTWTSLTGNPISPTTGLNINVQIDSTPAILRAIGTTPSCTNDTIIMTLNPNLAPAPTVVTPVVYCQFGSAAALSATGSPGGVLRYYTSDPSDTGTITPIVPNITVAGTYTYYVSQTRRGCVSPRSAITIVVNPPPPPPIPTGDSVYCLGSTMNLKVPFTTGANYVWSGPNGFHATTNTISKSGLVAKDSGIYSIVQTSGVCPTDTFYRNVIVYDLVAKISSKDAACKGDTIQISFGGITMDTGVTYTWQFLNNGIIRSGPLSAIGVGPYGIEYDTTGNKVVNLKINNFMCTSTTTKTIKVVVAPPVNYDIPKDICINDTVSVSVADYTLAGSDMLYWNWAGGTVVGGNMNSGSYQVTFNSTGQKVLTLAVDYQNLCLTQPKLDTVTVHDYPNVHIVSIADADPNKKEICVGDSVLLTVAQYPQYKYSWSPVKEFRPYQSTDNTAWAVLQSAGYVYVRAWDQYNCTAMDSMNVLAQPCCGVYLPDGFTPNGDGRNDVFKIITAGHQHIRTFRIVNRYGQTVFQGNSQNTGWDGNFNGVPQDIGTYFWFLSYDCHGKTIEEKGDVTLIR